MPNAAPEPNVSLVPRDILRLRRTRLTRERLMLTIFARNHPAGQALVCLDFNVVDECTSLIPSSFWCLCSHRSGDDYTKRPGYEYEPILVAGEDGLAAVIAASTYYTRISSFQNTPISTKNEETNVPVKHELHRFVGAHNSDQILEDLEVVANSGSQSRRDQKTLFDLKRV